MAAPVPHRATEPESPDRPGLWAWLHRIDFSRPRLGPVAVILGAAAFWLGVILKIFF
jgi:hypothetical protein